MRSTVMQPKYNHEGDFPLLTAPPCDIALSVVPPLLLCPLSSGVETASHAGHCLINLVNVR